ncbi:MAG: hypothetical protein KDA44_22985 [Planctomycetales bacterium]|nr:hypothetical protein [Planctomycetales bacterium]
MRSTLNDARSISPGHIVSVEHASSVLLKQLVTVGHRPEIDHAGAVVMCRSALDLTWSDRDGLTAAECDEEDFAGRPTRYVPAGLWPLVADVLADCGYTDVPQLAAPAPWAAPRLRKESLDYALLDAVRRQRSALVVHGTGVNRAHLIAQVLHAWPDARVLIVTQSMDEAHDLRRHLARQTPSLGLFVFGHRQGDPVVRRQYVATTIAGGGCGIAELHRRDLVIALEPVSFAQHKLTRYLLKGAARSRLIGFLPEERSLTRSERDWLTAWFGGQWLSAPQHGVVRRPLMVGVRDMRTRASRIPDDSTAATLRRDVWTRRPRHRHVGNLAWRVAQRGGRAMASMLPVDGLGAESLRVGVLAANLEHAMSLRLCLPDWPLVVGDDVDRRGLPRAERAKLRQATVQRLRPGRGYVITQAGMDRVQSLDVLIRADAGVGLLPLAWTEWDVCDSASLAALRPAAIVDLRDRGPGCWSRRWQQRLRAYLTADWRLPGVYPRPWDQFCAAQGEEMST